MLCTGQEPLWGAANKRVGPRISAKWRVETVLRAAALGTGCGSRPHRSHEQPSKPPVWAGTGSSCAPRAPWRTCLGRGRPPFGACWLYWGTGCSSPGQRPEATWGGRGHCSDGGGGIQPLAPSVCGSGAGDWIQVQALSGGGGSSWAGSSASWPHPRPPFVGGASDTLLSAQPSCPGAAGSGASGGCLWVRSGCPSHLLPGPWWPLSFRCWLTGPPAAVREPNAVTAPNPPPSHHGGHRSVLRAFPGPRSAGGASPAGPEVGPLVHRGPSPSPGPAGSVGCGPFCSQHMCSRMESHQATCPGPTSPGGWRDAALTSGVFCAVFTGAASPQGPEESGLVISCRCARPRTAAWPWPAGFEGCSPTQPRSRASEKCPSFSLWLLVVVGPELGCLPEQNGAHPGGSDRTFPQITPRVARGHPCPYPCGP
ncbi:transcription initiation factor TFIID subunit 4-like [Felis catus]|uniref:transcription initiation factor TFIID subunit 4-like n=1 Tax=Felis catus TaxID=9685 RepID=UPI001D19E4DD|nr:transcription initiation factor TFIID subunit 4-like [Felis catus]XP_044918471.1 transcription initiation factor TFIID subunit 4-like [Felis catus]XP_044918472.1 transcription initiation factor TFIID subunit 4-like [Felis catus]